MPSVLHLVTQREPAGAQGIAVALAHHHRTAGHASKTIFLYRKSPDFSQEPTEDLLEGPVKPWLLPLLLLRLWRRFRCERPRAVVAHTHWCIALVLPLAALARVPVRIAVHHSHRDLYPRPCRILERCWGHLGVATHLVAVSDSVAASFLPATGNYRRRLITIPNGVPLLPPPAGPPPLQVTGPLLVAVGRLSPEKDHRGIIEVLPQLPGVHLAIAGLGPLHEELLALAERLQVADRLHLLGACNRQGLADLLAAASLVVLPSTSEGLSLALVEALGAGVPVVASDLPTNRSTANGAAHLVPVGDRPALAAALKALLADPARCQALAALGRCRASCFDPAVMGNAYQRLIDHG